MLKRGLSRDAIKYMAIAAMTLNHAAHIFLLPGTLLYTVFVDVGYFTAITMCYFLVEGYEHTGDLKKYVQRLAIFAMAAQIPFYMAFHATAFDGRVMILNMLFSLLLSLLLIILDDSSLPQRQKNLLMLLCYVLSCFCDWPGMAAAFTMLFKRMKNRENGTRNAFLIAAGAFAAVSVLNGIEQGAAPADALVSGVSASAGLWVSGLVITRLYNGKRGKYTTFSKWLFYAYYPLHLLVLVGIRQLMH